MIEFFASMNPIVLSTMFVLIAFCVNQYAYNWYMHRQKALQTKHRTLEDDAKRARTDPVWVNASDPGYRNANLGSGSGQTSVVYGSSSTYGSGASGGTGPNTSGSSPDSKSSK